jgi:hypothetical protein
MYHLIDQSVTLNFCVCGFRMTFIINRDYLSNSVNKLIVITVKCGVLFEVRT